MHVLRDVQVRDTYMGRTVRIVSPPVAIASHGHVGLLEIKTMSPVESKTPNVWKSTTKRAETMIAINAERRMLTV